MTEKRKARKATGGCVPIMIPREKDDRINEKHKEKTHIKGIGKDHKTEKGRRCSDNFKTYAVEIFKNNTKKIGDITKKNDLVDEDSEIEEDCDDLVIIFVKLLPLEKLFFFFNHLVDIN